MSPGVAVCAAARNSGAVAIASTIAAAMICLTRLFFNERPVDRQVYHHSLPVIVLNQQDVAHRMAVLHLGPDADGNVAGIVVLGFLDGFAELAGRAEQTIVLLLRRCQVVSVSYSFGF